MQWAGDSWADGYCDGDPFLRVLFDNEEIPNRKKIAISSDKTTVVATYHEGPTGRLEFCTEPVDWTVEDKMLFTGKDDGKHMTFTIEAWGGVNTYVFSALRRLITRSSRRRRDVEERNAAPTTNKWTSGNCSSRCKRLWRLGVDLLLRYGDGIYGVLSGHSRAHSNGYWGLPSKRTDVLDHYRLRAGESRQRSCDFVECHRQHDRCVSSCSGKTQKLNFFFAESTNRLIHEA